MLKNITNIQIQNIDIYIKVMAGIFAIICAFIPVIVGIITKRSLQTIEINKKNQLKSWKRKKGFLTYETFWRFLKKNGADLNFDYIGKPIEFVQFSILSAFIFAILGLLFNNFWLIIPFGIFGLFVPALIVIYQNSIDNKNMLPDISLIYNSLYTQIQANIFVDQAIIESLSIIKNPRLYKQLNVLISNLNKHDMSFSDALNNFQLYFNNQQITSLCVILEQAKTSGKAAEALSNVLEQIKEVEDANLFLKQEKSATRNQLFQIALFALLVVVIIYYSIQFILSTFMAM